MTRSGDAGGTGTGPAVVLGAGGAAGWAFHAGVVAGMADVGMDLSDATRVVATSAGAPVAASMLAGATPDEIVSSLLRSPTEDEIARYRERLAEARSNWLSRLRPVAPRLAGEVLPGGAGVGVALAGLLPSGLFPTTPLRRAPGVEDLADRWPPGLWIPAVGLDDGQRVVFGRDRSDLAVADAVEASQAVPVMFAPRWIDGAAFVDGATHSPTNADLLVGGHPDAASGPLREVDRDVIVVAPMSRHPNRLMRRFARRRLQEELAVLRRAGLRITLVLPDDETASHLDGFPRKDPDAIPLVVAGGRRAALAALA